MSHGKKEDPRVIHHFEERVENPTNPNPGWDCRDFNMKVTGWFFVWTAIFVFISFIGMACMYNSYAKREARNGVAASPLVEGRDIPSHGPILQVVPGLDLDAYYRKEATRLTAIDAAMKAVAHDVAHPPKAVPDEPKPDAGKPEAEVEKAAPENPAEPEVKKD